MMDGSSLRHFMLSPRLVEWGGRCLDGSPGGFYFLPAASAENATKIVITFEGGGECRTATECSTWRGGSGPNSSLWPPSRHLALKYPELSTSYESNPDFHDWSKLFLPYCSADMHSGQRRTRDEELGGFFFAGHYLVAGSLQQLANHRDFREPNTVLVTGGSAGGIGALFHANFLARWWPQATVKVSPAGGFFYAGVSSLRDWEANHTTPSRNLGFIENWNPYLDESCADATNGNISICTNAHSALRYIRTPVFIRENLFDTAKLANCGVDTRGPLTASQLLYLKRWGAWMRAQLATISLDVQHQASGFFAPSCLNHAENLGWGSAPRLGGVALRDAMRRWFFAPDSSPLAPPPRLSDDCGDLPCTQSAEGRCSHLPTDPLDERCSVALVALCPGLQWKGAACDACVRHHAAALHESGCPDHGEPVLEWWCDDTAHHLKGHHVCDLDATGMLLSSANLTGIS